MTVSLSTFTRSPARVLSMLDTGDVLLTRRNGPSLLLTVVSADMGETAAPAEPDFGPADPARAELDALVAVLLRMVTGRQLLAALLGCCPWMSDLPPAARRAVLAALTPAPAAATPPTAAPGQPEPETGSLSASQAEDVLAQWRQRARLFQSAQPA